MKDDVPPSHREKPIKSCVQGLKGITLLEVLVALTIVSTILLPISMYLIEYVKGTNELGNFHQVMNLVEEKMELSLAQPFGALPLGTTENRRLTREGKEVLDLRPMEVGDSTVSFTMMVEMVPLEFAGISDPSTGIQERTRVEEMMKRLTIRAVWGKKREHAFDLMAFKADL